MSQINSIIPLSLYIHLPWCIKKCPYCDFNSHKAPETIPEQAYIDALIQDLDSQLENIWGRRILSIFIGGGTPSLFSAESLETLLHAIHARLNYHTNIEITLEANPGTVELTRFKGFRQAGINRLSIGIQSFCDKQLQRLGRIHNSHEAHRAIEAAIEAGFDNFNLDLMFALPQQSIKDALSDLQSAIRYQPKHISWYQLTLEPNTLFYAKPPGQLPDSDQIADMHDAGLRLLLDNQWQQYEVSAYCRDQAFCVHNKNYWKFGDYLGIGAGAHSKITNINDFTVTRHWNVKNPRDYLNPQTDFIGEKKVINQADLIFEFMLNALRLNQTLDGALFTNRTGLEFRILQDTLDKGAQKKLLSYDQNSLELTTHGKRFLNDVIELFIPDDRKDENIS